MTEKEHSSRVFTEDIAKEESTIKGEDLETSEETGSKSLENSAKKMASIFPPLEPP